MTAPTAEPRLTCPRCGGQAIEVSPARAGVCTPFPALEALRCPGCGNTGTRMVLRERTIVQWSRG